MAARNLHRRPVRTGLTALGVAMGVVAVVAFTTIVRGLWDAVDAAVHFADTELLVFQADIAADFLSVLDEEETRAKLSAIPGVENAVGSLWHALPVDKHLLFFTLGLRVEDLRGDGEGLIHGCSLTSDDEVLLGRIAQRILHKDVGDTLRIHDESYRVAGVFETEAIFFDGAIVLSLPRLQKLAGKEGQVTVFQVFLDPGVDAAAVAEQIEREHPDLVAVGGASEYHKADQSLVIANGMIWAVSFLAIVIGSIIVTNTMWMSVFCCRAARLPGRRGLGQAGRRHAGQRAVPQAGLWRRPVFARPGRRGRAQCARRRASGVAGDADLAGGGPAP